MTFEALLLGALSPLILMIIGWIFTRAVKQAEKMHSIDVRLTKSEERLHGHSSRLTATEEAVLDIRAHMVRREDLSQGLEALGQRIDDALRK